MVAASAGNTDRGRCPAPIRRPASTADRRAARRNRRRPHIHRRSRTCGTGSIADSVWTARFGSRHSRMQPGRDGRPRDGRQDDLRRQLLAYPACVAPAIQCPLEPDRRPRLRRTRPAHVEPLPRGKRGRLRCRNHGRRPDRLPQAIPVKPVLAPSEARRAPRFCAGGNRPNTPNLSRVVAALVYRARSKRPTRRKRKRYNVLKALAARNVWEASMPKTITTPQDAAEHLHAAEGVTAYPDACMEPASRRRDANRQGAERHRKSQVHVRRRGYSRIA